METQVSQQLLTFGMSVLLGLSAGVLYDLLRPFRLRFPRSTALLDTAYCLAVGGAGFLFLLRRGDGELRGFLILGALGGAVLFFCAFSLLLRPVWAFWADTLVLLARLAALPLLWLRQFCKKTRRWAKNIFYFTRKCYTICKISKHAQKEAANVATKKSASKPARAGLLTKLLIVVLLAALGWQLYDLRQQVQDAQTERDRYAQQVAAKEQENDALSADIAEGMTPEKVEEIAREQLGLVTPGEYVFYDISN